MDSIYTNPSTVEREGTVSCNTQDTFSGPLEGFGLLAALKFLIAYLHQTQTNPHEDHSLKIYCNNLGIIQLLQNMQETI